jgi:hypothetical protein
MVNQLAAELGLEVAHSIRFIWPACAAKIVQAVAVLSAPA